MLQMSAPRPQPYSRPQYHQLRPDMGAQASEPNDDWRFRRGSFVMKPISWVARQPTRAPPDRLGIRLADSAARVRTRSATSWQKTRIDLERKCPCRNMNGPRSGLGARPHATRRSTSNAGNRPNRHAQKTQAGARADIEAPRTPAEDGRLEATPFGTLDEVAATQDLPPSKEDEESFCLPTCRYPLARRPLQCDPQSFIMRPVTSAGAKDEQMQREPERP